MAANTAPVFPNVPIVGAGLTSVTSQAALSGTSLTNGTTIVTGTTNGTKVEEITIVATGTSILGTVNIFLVDVSNNWWFQDQAAIIVQTLTTGTPLTRWNKAYPNLIVPSGYTLSVTQTSTGTQIPIAVTALGGTF